MPVLDAQGNVSEVYGRKLRDELRAGTPRICTCRGRTVACGTCRPAKPQEIILCEALIDALTFWCAGYRNVTSAYGMEGFTDDIWPHSSATAPSAY